MKENYTYIFIVFFIVFLVSSYSYAFTLRNVERKCEVWRWSENWGDVECRGS